MEPAHLDLPLIVGPTVGAGGAVSGVVEKVRSRETHRFHGVTKPTYGCSNGSYPDFGGSVMRCRTVVLMLLMLATLHRTAWGEDIEWKNPVSGNWGTPSNWDPAQVPDAADNAIITVSGTYTVTLDVTATVTAVNLGGPSGTQTLAIGANTLTLTGPSTVDTHGVLNMGAGVLSGGDVLTVNVAFNWTGGTQS